MSLHDSLPKRRAPQQPRRHRSSSTETVESKLPTVLKKVRRPPPRRPASLLFVRSDSYGDLILFEPVLRWIRHHWPETRVGVLLKRTYVDLTSLLVDGIDWIPVEADPLREDIEAASARGEIGRAVRVFAPELLVAPCYNKTWFEVLAGLAAPNCRQVRVGPLNLDPMTLAALARLGITIPPPIYADEVAAEELLTEVEKTTGCSTGWPGARFRVRHPPCMYPKSRKPRRIKSWPISVCPNDRSWFAARREFRSYRSNAGRRRHLSAC
jgi:hypothetical protein